MFSVYKDWRTKACSLEEIKRIWRNLNLRNFVKYSCCSKKSVTVMGFLTQALPISLAIGKGYLTVAVSIPCATWERFLYRKGSNHHPSFPQIKGFSAVWDFLSWADWYDWLAFIQVIKLNHHCKSDSCQSVVLRVAVSDHPGTCLKLWELPPLFRLKSEMLWMGPTISILMISRWF